MWPGPSSSLPRARWPRAQPGAAPRQAEGRDPREGPRWLALLGTGVLACGLRGREGRGAVPRPWLVLQESQSLLPSWVGGLELMQGSPLGMTQRRDRRAAVLALFPAHHGQISFSSVGPQSLCSPLSSRRASVFTLLCRATRWEEARLPRPSSLQPRAFACVVNPSALSASPS